MTQEQIKSYLEELEIKLCSESEQHSIELNRVWARQFPVDAGVYLIRENGIICYVGETGSISERMADLLNTKNHVIRRNIGNIEYKNEVGFDKASAKKGYVPEIEAKLNKYIVSKLRVSALVVELGRKEFEEYLSQIK